MKDKLLGDKLEGRDKNGRFMKGHKAWSIGLTKKENPSLMSISKKVSLAQKGIPEKDWVKKQTSEVMIEYYKNNPEKGKLCRKKQLEKRWIDPEQHERASERMKINNPMFIPEIREKHNKIVKSKEFSENARKQTRKAMEDKNWYLKVFSRREPSSLEIDFLNLITENKLPYKYVGNVKNKYLVIGKKVPDFIHFSEPKVIEIWGEYFKKDRNSSDLIKHYENYGYDCIIIKGAEFNNKDKVLSKVIDFTNGGK